MLSQSQKNPELHAIRIWDHSSRIAIDNGNGSKKTMRVLMKDTIVVPKISKPKTHLKTGSSRVRTEKKKRNNSFGFQRGRESVEENYGEGHNRLDPPEQSE